MSYNKTIDLRRGVNNLFPLAFFESFHPNFGHYIFYNYGIRTVYFTAMDRKEHDKRSNGLKYATQSQTAAIDYLRSKQLLLLAFVVVVVGVHV